LGRLRCLFFEFQEAGEKYKNEKNQVAFFKKNSLREAGIFLNFAA
jgi:hypothetical protein